MNVTQFVITKMFILGSKKPKLFYLSKYSFNFLLSYE
jgi:hypothetical protein